jgi:hypothetical protein
MAGPLVDLHDGLLVRGLRQAEHDAGGRVAPRVLEVHALVGLDVEVGLVRFQQGLGRDALHPVMHVHELGHAALLLLGVSPTSGDGQCTRDRHLGESGATVTGVTVPSRSGA